MWPMLGRLALQYGIPTLTGLATYKDIYEKTGDPGKAAVGAGVAGVGSAGLGMAGQRLAGTATRSLARAFPSYKAAGMFAPAIGTAAAAVPFATQAVFGAVPVMAGGLAAGMTPGIFGPGGGRKASDALRGPMAALGTGRELMTPEATGAWEAGPVPSLAGYGPYSYADIAALNSPARGELLRGRLEAENQLLQQKILKPYEFEMATKARNAELLREAAGAQLRTRLGLGAQMMSQAQLGAQALSQAGANAMSQALVQRGGYV